MTKAEERALEAYNAMFHNPEKMSVRSTVSEEEAAQFDYKEPFKAFFLDVYQQGYEQAEKDLALTWRDIMAICEHYVDVNYEYDYHSIQEKYEEILCRFKEEKK